MLKLSLTGVLRAPALTPTPGLKPPESTCCTALIVGYVNHRQTKPKRAAATFTQRERPIKDYSPPPPLFFLSSPDNVLSLAFKVSRGYISKRARHSETGTTLWEHFLLIVYENLNSFPLNGKQRLKRGRNHQHVRRNSFTLLVAITKRGKVKGESVGGGGVEGIMRGMVALPSILWKPLLASSQNYQHPFMIIYRTVALIMEWAKWGCFIFFLELLEYVQSTKSHLTFLHKIAFERAKIPCFYTTRVCAFDA